MSAVNVNKEARPSLQRSKEVVRERPNPHSEYVKYAVGDEDVAILGAIAEGDILAFWALWQRYQKYLFAICLRQMGGIHADAEDALSRAMLRALDRMPQYAGTLTNPKAWLTRLTHNVCIEAHREQNRRRGKQNSEDGAAINYRRPDSLRPSSPEDALLRSEMFALLTRMIDGLTTRLREPFVLRFAYEMSCTEIGAMLSISNENVRKRIQQARGILRAEFL